MYDSGWSLLLRLCTEDIPVTAAWKGSAALMAILPLSHISVTVLEFQMVRSAWSFVGRIETYNESLSSLVSPIGWLKVRQVLIQLGAVGAKQIIKKPRE